MYDMKHGNATTFFSSRLAPQRHTVPGRLTLGEALLVAYCINLLRDKGIILLDKNETCFERRKYIARIIDTWNANLDTLFSQLFPDKSPIDNNSYQLEIKLFMDFMNIVFKMEDKNQRLKIINILHFLVRKVNISSLKEFSVECDKKYQAFYPGDLESPTRCSFNPYIGYHHVPPLKSLILEECPVDESQYQSGVGQYDYLAMADDFQDWHSPEELTAPMILEQSQNQQNVEQNENEVMEEIPHHPKLPEPTDQYTLQDKLNMYLGIYSKEMKQRKKNQAIQRELPAAVYLGGIFGLSLPQANPQTEASNPSEPPAFSSEDVETEKEVQGYWQTNRRN